jgi:hypothetical protein
LLSAAHPQDPHWLDNATQEPETPTAGAPPYTVRPPIIDFDRTTLASSAEQPQTITPPRSVALAQHFREKEEENQGK